jgi:hypothetical protein
MTTPKAGRETGMMERAPEISERVNPVFFPLFHHSMARAYADHERKMG